MAKRQSVVGRAAMLAAELPMAATGVGLVARCLHQMSSSEQQPAITTESGVKTAMNVTFMTSKPVLSAITGTFMCFLASASVAEGTEMLTKIRQTAEQFALTQINDPSLHDLTAEATNLDARLQLRKCELPLEAFASSNGANPSRMTVGVRCTGQSPWTLYVPVNIRATTDVVYTTRALARGDSPGAADLEVRRMPLDELPPKYVSSINRLNNMELVRPLRSGTPLTLTALKARDIVQQGQEVVIVAQTAGVQVRMAGKALKNGSFGDRIPVRNINSGRTVEATVSSSSTVTVKL